MSDPTGPQNAASKDVRLAEAIREVKNAIADRTDVVVELRHVQRTRLELLADELKPVFDQVDEDDDRFDFAISSGTQPRLWIDAVAHVTMGRDRRTYRFLRDTRLGRVVLAEAADMKPVADQVTRYIAERIIERRRVLEDDLPPAAGMPGDAADTTEDAPAPSRFAAAAPLPAGFAAANDVPAAAVPEKRKTSPLRAFVLLLAGLAIGAGLILFLGRDRLGEMGLDLEALRLF